MTMHLIALGFIGLLLGQSGSRPPLSEAEFRAVVQRLVTDERIIDDRVTEFAVQHDDVAVPILVEGIKARWAKRSAGDAAVPILSDDVHWNPAPRTNRADKQAVGTIFTLMSLATDRAEEPSVDAVGDLCSEYPTDCRFFVHQLLMSATVRQHYFTTASELARQYPGLREMVVGYVEARLKNGNAYGYAQELLERVARGDKIESDVILIRLAPPTRDRVMRALDRLNQDGQRPAPR